MIKGTTPAIPVTGADALLPDGGGLPLTQLYLYLSPGCSLTCHHPHEHCRDAQKPPANGNHHGNGNGSGSHLPHLPIERISQAVHEALPLGLTTVRLTGGGPLGGPLLYPDFDLLLDGLESLELRVEIDTNGSGMTPLVAARLARLPQCSVFIGLDGADPATHDALYGTPGSFTTATEAIRLLATAGLAPHIITTVMRRNAGQVSALVRLVEGLGASSIRFLLPDPEPAYGSNGNGNGNGNGHHPPAERPETLSVEELIALGRRIERDIAHTTRLNLLFEQPPAFRGLFPMARVAGTGRCNVLTTLSVLPSGDYTLCGASGDASPELIFGRAGDTALARVWADHPILNALRAGLSNRLDGVCGHCIMQSACQGSCAAENYLRTGSFWGPYWFCDAAARAGLFPAGRITENRW